jgi:hypothetical protein
MLCHNSIPLNLISLNYEAPHSVIFTSSRYFLLLRPKLLTINDSPQQNPKADLDCYPISSHHFVTHRHLKTVTAALNIWSTVRLSRVSIDLVSKKWIYIYLLNLESQFKILKTHARVQREWITAKEMQELHKTFETHDSSTLCTALSL